MATELLLFTFNVVLLLVVTYISNTFLRLLVKTTIIYLQCLFSLVVMLMFWEFLVSGE